MLELGNAHSRRGPAEGTLERAKTQTIPALALASPEPREPPAEGEPLLRTWSEPLDVYCWTERAHALVGRILQFRPLAPALSQSFQCPLCCEDVRGEDRVMLSQCCSVEHGCCRLCMKRYVGSLVADGRVDSIRCPVRETCSSVVQPSEILRLTDRATFVKYERFRQMQGDPSLRQCFNCDTLCSPKRDEEGGIILEMKCHKCGAEFCFHHSNAHAGESCEAYRQQMDEDEHYALSLDTETKPCPGCSILTDKISGCNHMTCSRCKKEWCWMCGDSIDDVSAHFSADNPKGCRQFTEQSTPLTDRDALVFFCCVIMVLGFLVMGAFWCFHLKLQKWVFWVFTFYCVCCCCRSGATPTRR